MKNISEAVDKILEGVSSKAVAISVGDTVIAKKAEKFDTLLNILLHTEKGKRYTVYAIKDPIPEYPNGYFLIYDKDTDLYAEVPKEEFDDYFEIG